MTIDDLRKQLDEWESKWTGVDDKHLGPFGSQTIFVDYYSNLPNENSTYQGLGPAKLIPYWELGLCIVSDREKVSEQVG